MIKSAAIVVIFLFSGITADAQPDRVKHVILIGIDGLGAFSFQRAEMPNLRNLMKRGSWSLEARSVLPSSSAVNWSSMVMGAGPELHGFTTWGSKKPDLPSRVLDKYGMFPSVYSLLREKEPDSEIGVIYEWEGIGYLFPKKAVDLDKHCATDSLSTKEAVKYILGKQPNFLFSYFHHVDVTGHGKGFGTKAYYEAIRKVDQQIGDILNAIAEAGMTENTVIIVTADHGGIEKGHGGKTMTEMQIPWIIAGPGIKKGHKLISSIMTFDTAATIAKILNLRIPQVWIGRPVTEAFINP